MADTLVSCIIPCYCSSATVGSVVDEIERTAAQRDGYAYEIVLVNDGSPDDGATARTITDLAQRSPRTI